ncbi:MAG: ABC transporter permease [Streptomycetaceae bacterium]|nr:MAG: ABC transporter permease [Streptomycetaceae bacterium]
MKDLESNKERDAIQRRALLSRLIFLVPGVTYIVVLMLIPLGFIFVYTFLSRGTYGGIETVFTLSNYTRALDPLYLKVLLDSILIATITTLLAFAIGFPVAYAITKLPAHRQNLMLVLIVLPFWTNFLIRTYAWIVLLNTQGFLNQGLMKLGVLSQPISLLYKPSAVVLGLLYAYLPLMILPIYSALVRIDPAMREAAVDLGASPSEAFRQVTLPLAIPGVLIGGIFVFVPSLGNFIVPELLGGGKMIMVGNLIRDQFLKARDWPFGSVLALSMVLMLLLLFFIQARINKRILGVNHA